jgi:hypothetical protein
MSYSLRIDDIVQNPDTTVDVFYTSGIPPIPVTPSGNFRHFASRSALITAINNIQSSSGIASLTLIALIRGINADSTGTNKFKSMSVGDTVTVDFSNKSNIISVKKDDSYNKPGTGSSVRLLVDYPGVPGGTILTKSGEWYENPGLKISIHEKKVISSPEEFGPN